MDGGCGPVPALPAECPEPRPVALFSLAHRILRHSDAQRTRLQEKLQEIKPAPLKLQCRMSVQDNLLSIFLPLRYGFLGTGYGQGASLMQILQQGSLKA